MQQPEISIHPLIGRLRKTNLTHERLFLQEQAKPTHPHAADSSAARHIPAQHPHTSHQTFPYTRDPE